MEQLNESLLSAWLRLSSTIDNQRLVKGMSFNEALVCNLLVHARRQGRTLTARDLCRMRSMKTGIVSVAIEQLTSNGFLERRTDSADRRIQRLCLTEKAIPLVEEGRAQRKRFFERLKQGMTAEEFEIYFHLTMKLQSTVEEMAEELQSMTPARFDTCRRCCLWIIPAFGGFCPESYGRQLPCSSAPARFPRHG